MATVATHQQLPFEYSLRWADIYEDLTSGDDGLVRDAVAALEQRDKTLEDFLARVKRPITWNHHGLLTVSEGDDWPVETPFSPNLFVAKLKLAPNPGTEVALVLNGTTDLAVLELDDALIHSVRIDDNDLRLEPFVDWLHTEVRAIGTGAKGYVASCYGA